MFNQFSLRATRIYKSMAKEDVIVMAGFIGGISWVALDTYKPMQDFCESPLSTLFVGSFYGMFTSMVRAYGNLLHIHKYRTFLYVFIRFVTLLASGSIFVADMMPHRLLRPVIPISIGISILYQCYKVPEICDKTRKTFSIEISNKTDK